MLGLSASHALILAVFGLSCKFAREDIIVCCFSAYGATLLPQDGTALDCMKLPSDHSIFLSLYRF
jgi:hypothetical protein